MGGIVATSLLPHDNIAAVITMSTPHMLPPARFDRRIGGIYAKNRYSLVSDPTPIMSLCGGATDLMVPSESCYLPNTDVDLETPSAPYRRTIFSSSLEGSWTGVGHREMVWCHQVRWRIARAAIELTGVRTPAAQGEVLDFWLRDGHFLPPGIYQNQESWLVEGEHQKIQLEQKLMLRNPTHARGYELSVPRHPSKLVLYLSQGSIPPTAPHNPLPLHATVGACNADNECKNLTPTSLRLLPSPIIGRPFPVPQEGSDESEGIVLFEKEFSGNEGPVRVSVDGTDGRGWVVAGFVELEDVVDESSAFGESQ